MQCSLHPTRMAFKCDRSSPSMEMLSSQLTWLIIRVNGLSQATCLIDLYNYVAWHRAQQGGTETARRIMHHGGIIHNFIS